jgi:hypothetical protein
MLPGWSSRKRATGQDPGWSGQGGAERRADRQCDGPYGRAHAGEAADALRPAKLRRAVRAKAGPAGDGR